MLERFRNKKVTVYYASNSGMASGSTGSGFGYFVTFGILSDFDDKFLKIESALTSTVPQVVISKIQQISSNEILISLDKVISISV